MPDTDPAPDTEDPGFLITYPAYTLLTYGGGRPLVGRHGDVRLIPVFTDLDAAMTFVERAGVACTLGRAADGDALLAFLAGFRPSDLVEFDPVDAGQRRRNVYRVDQIRRVPAPAGSASPGPTSGR